MAPARARVLPKDAAVIETIAAAQQEELEREIAGLKAEAERRRSGWRRKRGNWREKCRFKNGRIEVIGVTRRSASPIGKQSNC